MGQKKLKRKKCDICRNYFVPTRSTQVRCASDVPGEISECCKKAKVLHSRKFIKRFKDKNGMRYFPKLHADIKSRQKEEFEMLQPSADRQRKRRTCLGTLCMGEKTFMSRGPFNRICERCETAEQNYGGKFVNMINYNPLKYRRDIPMLDNQEQSI